MVCTRCIRTPLPLQAPKVRIFVLKVQHLECGWKSTFGFPFSSTIPALVRSWKLSPVRRGFKVEYPVLLAFFLYLKQYLYRSIQFSIAFSVSFFPRPKNLGRSRSLADLDTITADVLHSKRQILFQKNSFQTVFILIFYDLLRTQKSFWVL